jgi:hypothetical protein
VLRTRLGRTATLAAALWLVQGIITSFHGQPSDGWDALDRVGELFLAAALVASVAVLLQVHALEEHRYARYGAALAAAGCTDLALASLVSLVSGGQRLEALFVLGIAGALIGLTAFAVGAAFGVDLSGGIAFLLLVTFFLGILFTRHGGGILIAVGFQAFGLGAARSVGSHMKGQ